jgi:hypothetical protein
MPQAVQRGLPLFLICLWACSAGSQTGGAAGGGQGAGAEGNAGGSAGNTDPGIGGSAEGGAGGGTTKPIVTQDPDAGSPGPSHDANAPDTGKAALACPFLFCEDFESSATINTKVWTVRKDGGNTVAIDAAKPAHGKNAVKFHASAQSGLAMIFAKLASSEVRQHLWGRAYFLVTPEPPEGHTAFVTAGTMDGYPYSDDHQEIAGYNNSWQLGFWGDGEIISAGGKIPLKTWACIEWEMNNDVGNMTVYVNGTRSHAGAGYGRNKIATGFTDVAFGFRSWHPANYDVDISMDDIAIDKARVGCLP